MHDVLGRNLGRVFSSALRYKVDTYLYKIDQISTSEFINALESPSVVYLLTVKELGGEVIVVLPSAFCLHLIERQSGGRGVNLVERRTLTTIEEKIISRIMAGVNREIISAWEPYMDFSIRSVDYENKPENIHLSSVDPTIVANLHIDLGKEAVPIKISYPYSLLKEAMNDSVLKRGNQSRQETLSEHDRESYMRTLIRTEVCIQPLLGTTNMFLKDVLNLKEGDIIPLNQRTDKPLEVRVNNVEKLKAFPGLVQGRKAVKIYEIIEEINEQELL